MLVLKRDAVGRKKQRSVPRDGIPRNVQRAHVARRPASSASREDQNSAVGQNAIPLVPGSGNDIIIATMSDLAPSLSHGDGVT